MTQIEISLHTKKLLLEFTCKESTYLGEVENML